MRLFMTCVVLVIVASVLVACVPGLSFTTSAGERSKSEEYEAVFAYGTLLDPDVQERVIGRVVEPKSDVLPGYRKGTLKLTKNSYFIAVRDPEHAIEGGVIMVSPSELERIDRYEGKHYERARIVLQSGIEAWVYREWETV